MGKCIDCKHVMKRGRPAEYWRCGATRSPVDGGRGYRFCSLIVGTGACSFEQAPPPAPRGSLTDAGAPKGGGLSVTSGALEVYPRNVAHQAVAVGLSIGFLLGWLVGSLL